MGIESSKLTPLVFAHMCQLLDMATLDVNCLEWKPFELAASILYHFSSQATSHKVSNLNMMNLIDCVHWLTPMALTLKDYGLLDRKRAATRPDQPRDYKRCPTDQWYNLQRHDPEFLDLLETAAE